MKVCFVLVLFVNTPTLSFEKQWFIYVKSDNTIKDTRIIQRQRHRIQTRILQKQKHEIQTRITQKQRHQTLTRTPQKQKH